MPRSPYQQLLGLRRKTWPAIFLYASQVVLAGLRPVPADIGLCIMNVAVNHGRDCPLLQVSVPGQQEKHEIELNSLLSLSLSLSLSL